MIAASALPWLCSGEGACDGDVPCLRVPRCGAAPPAFIRDFRLNCAAGSEPPLQPTSVEVRGPPRSAPPPLSGAAAGLLGRGGAGVCGQRHRSRHLQLGPPLQRPRLCGGRRLGGVPRPRAVGVRRPAVVPRQASAQARGGCKSVTCGPAETDTGATGALWASQIYNPEHGNVSNCNNSTAHPDACLPGLLPCRGRADFAGLVSAHVTRGQGWWANKLRLSWHLWKQPFLNHDRVPPHRLCELLAPQTARPHLTPHREGQLLPLRLPCKQDPLRAVGVVTHPHPFIPLPPKVWHRTSRIVKLILLLYKLFCQGFRQTEATPPSTRPLPPIHPLHLLYTRHLHSRTRGHP